ncbi:hypothetical protein PInf_005916 [Phytophthora infestans]|nr:hypothetical protein PInf_005916 [Phytophthora infestans]
MVASAGKGPPGRTPRTTEPGHTAGETKERHAQLLTKLSDRHRRHLLQDSAALSRFVALTERNGVAPRHRDSTAHACIYFDESGCADSVVIVGARDDRDRTGGGGGDTAGAQENAEPAKSAFANADRVSSVAEAKQPASAKPQKKRAAKYRTKLTTPAMEVRKATGVYKPSNPGKPSQDAEAKDAESVEVDATDVAAEAMAIPSSSAAPTEAQVPLEPAVVEIMADLMSNLESEVAARVENDADTLARTSSRRSTKEQITPRPPALGTSRRPPKPRKSSQSKKRRRPVLQDDNLVSGDDEDAVGTTGAPPGLSTGDGKGEEEG